MRYLIIAQILCTLAGLSGCATPQTVTASEDAIAVDVWGTGGTSRTMVRTGTKVAAAHCASYGKRANLERITGPLGVPQILYYSCK
jgi:hypothetical protein